MPIYRMLLKFGGRWEFARFIRADDDEQARRLAAVLAPTLRAGRPEADDGDAPRVERIDDRVEPAPDKADGNGSRGPTTPGGASSQD